MTIPAATIKTPTSVTSKFMPCDYPVQPSGWHVTISRCATRAATAAVILLSGFTSLPAADTTFVQTGDRVRLEAPVIRSGKLIGEVAALDGDTLLLLSAAAGPAIPVPTSDIQQIAVSQGKKSNAILGLIVGAGVGIAASIGLSIWVCNADDDGCTTGQVVWGSLGVTAITAGLGAGIGAVIRTERWQDASLPPPRSPIGLSFGGDGSVRLRYSLRL